MLNIVTLIEMVALLDVVAVVYVMAKLDSISNMLSSRRGSR